MFNKIYSAVFAVAFLIMAFLTAFCYFKLQSKGFSPDRVVQNFESYDSIYKTVFWISSLALLALANVVLWKTRKSWALWTTFAYFVVFILLNTWWLNEMLVSYQKNEHLPESGFIMTGIVGAISCVIAGIGVFFNQFLVTRMLDKMFDKPQENTETIANTEITEDKTEEVSHEEVASEEEKS